MSYDPTEPFILKSGKYEGKTVSQIAIINFPWLNYLFNKMNKPGGCQKKNKLHIHLEWIMKRIEGKEPKILCPVCKEKKVKFLSVLGTDRYGYSLSESFLCCDEEKCKERLKDLALGKNNWFIPAKFSSITKFKKKLDQKRIANLLKKIYGLDGGALTKNKAFNFFKEE